MNQIKLEQLSENYFNHLLAGNRKDASKLCHSFINEGNSILQLYESIMKPALYKVGQLWEQNKITVAAEHLATAITEGVLNELYPQIIPEKYNGKKIVLACVDKEEHQVGIKMAADIFELQGWESLFLGTGFPTNELIKYVEQEQPDLLGISLSVFYNFKNFTNMIAAVSEAFPNLPIIVGGQAFEHIVEDDFKKLANITHVSGLVSLMDYISNY